MSVLPYAAPEAISPESEEVEGHWTRFFSISVLGLIMLRLVLHTTYRHIGDFLIPPFLLGLIGVGIASAIAASMQYFAGRNRLRYRSSRWSLLLGAAHALFCFAAIVIGDSGDSKFHLYGMIALMALVPLTTPLVILRLRE